MEPKKEKLTAWFLILTFVGFYIMVRFLYFLWQLIYFYGFYPLALSNLGTTSIDIIYCAIGVYVLCNISGIITSFFGKWIGPKLLIIASILFIGIVGVLFLYGVLPWGGTIEINRFLIYALAFSLINIIYLLRGKITKPVEATAMV